MAEITTVDDHIVDIELVRHTEERLRSFIENQQHHCGKKQLICRVPKKFHEIDGSDYVPRRWSIGPYHNGDERLEKYEMSKLSILHSIGQRSQVTVEKYYKELQCSEEEARSYYSGYIPMNSLSFLEMLLLDSCFILDTLNILQHREKSADSIGNSSNTGKNSMRNNGENRCAQNSNQDNPGFVGEEHSDQYNLRGSRARSDEINPADSSRDCYNTGSNHKENNEENRGAQNPNGSSHGFVGEENSEQNNVNHSVKNDLIHDMLLFENQIPFFILQKMYNVATGNETPNKHVASQLGTILKHFIQHISKTTVRYGPPENFYHLLHLLHCLLEPSKERNDSSQVGSSWLIKRLRPWCQVFGKWLAEKLSQWKCQTDNNQQKEESKRWRRAVEYYEAGVHFRLPRKSSHSPLDIEFENGELRIPKLIIDEKTSYIFGNLLAFEEETHQFGYDITTYITFMSQLLCMPEDVTLLSRKGIIEHHLGCDEDVSELFKNLTKFRFVDMGPKNYLKPVCDVLEKHYENHWNRWFAWLRHKHMTNPWLILGLVVAAIVAISAVVQALCSMASLAHGN